MTKMHDIFISHCKDDRKATAKIRDLLKAAKLDVYVDLDDPALCEITDHALADRLRERILHCRVLLFVLSAKAINSSWMPWELGLAHGAVGRILIWPLTKSATSAIAKQEYLTLYECVNPLDIESTIEKIKSIAVQARKSIFPPSVPEVARLAGEHSAELQKFAAPPEATGISVKESSKVSTAYSEGISGGSSTTKPDDDP